MRTHIVVVLMILIISAGCGKTPAPTSVPAPATKIPTTELSPQPCSGQPPCTDPFNGTPPEPVIDPGMLQRPVPFSVDALAALIPEGARARLGLGKLRGLISSPDGSRIAVGTTIGVHVFEVPGLTHLWSIPIFADMTYERWRTHFAWSPDGRFIAAGLGAEGFIVINAATGKEQWHYTEYAYVESDYVNYTMAKFSPDGKYVASSGCPARAENDSFCGNRMIHVWEAETGSLIASAQFEDYDFEWSPDGTYIGWETTILIGTTNSNALNVQTGQPELIAPIPEPDNWHHEYVYAASPDGSQVALNLSDIGYRGISIRSNATHEQTQAVELRTETGFDFITWPQADLIVAAESGWYDEDWYIVSIDLNQPEVPESAIASPVLTISVDWSPNMKYLLTGGHQGFSVLDSTTGQVVKSCGQEEANSYYSIERFRSMVWLPDNPTLVAGNYYAYADDDAANASGIWDVTTCKLQDGPTSGPANVEPDDIEWSPDRQLAAAAINGQLIVWRTDTGTEIIKPEHNIPALGISGVAWGEFGETHLAWSPDAALLAIAEEVYGGVRLTVVRIATQEIIYQTHVDHGRYLETNPCVEWAPDSQRVALYESKVRRNELAMLYTDPFLSVHNVTTGKIELEANLNNESPYELSRMLAMVWSSDGRWIITGHGSDVESADRKPVYPGSDAAIYLWDAVSGKLARTLRGHTGSVLGFDWSPDGYTLASISDDGTIILWDLP
jgi:WD40 repeat protein